MATERPITSLIRPMSPADIAATSAVVSFTLVNADTDQDIQLLAAGATLNLGTLPTRNLNIRATTDPGVVGSVVFALSGTQTKNLTESVAPYALFSDFQGDYFVWTPAVGAYSLTATPYSEAGGGGEAGTPLTLNFTVIDPTATLTSFILVDADTDQDIQTIASGATLNLTTLPTRNLNIRVNTNASPVGSIVFALSGQQTQSITESIAPYALFGDFQGNYNVWTPTVGTYSLTATPYSEANGAGNPGTALSISFSVVDVNGSVSSFTLVNADTDQDIQTIAPGATLNLATLPTRNLNIRANTSPATVGSVVFAMSGQQSGSVTESVVPYAMFGDVQGDYNVWTPAVGTYTLTATPFPLAAAGGTAGTALTLSFSVVDNVNPLPVTLTAFTVQTQGQAVQLSWSTASELNNREFVVQRSLDGRIFADLITIPGQGSTATAHQYVYLDTQVPATATVFYYRLRQIDYSGESVFSPIRTVTVPADVSLLQVYPTVVADGRLHYLLAGEPPHNGQLELFTMQGRRVGLYPVVTDASGIIPTKDLPVGVYMVRFTSAAGSAMTRFVVP
ncbi:T9SS type A sorting domain-containing protein [Hymenobacter elongatus]|uniref:T9SS type A sorting domain-containing protein n=1 Tax=Hymenobacter elongatus TaxID=877208 RepID=A0A4Z0PFW8_9BACT|nr:T9SS type A sorting domain-containing protein [Hymenobacter elongatus]TGE14052.1 T9SS type A sorting domain-containing protein [Hymenobacter elongatus]